VQQRSGKKGWSGSEGWKRDGGGVAGSSSAASVEVEVEDEVVEVDAGAMVGASSELGVSDSSVAVRWSMDRWCSGWSPAEEAEDGARRGAALLRWHGCGLKSG
jgi:hypothetical protein